MQQHHDTKRFMYRQINISESREYSEKEIPSMICTLERQIQKNFFKNQ